MSIEQQCEELERILHSAQFRRAPKLQKLLTVICRYQFENRSSEINEFLIASEAFGKGPEFDPSQDSIVRVQAREARRRLREYYQQEGKGSRLVLDVPVGSYIPIFRASEERRPWKRRLGAIWRPLGVAVLVGVGLLLVLDLRQNAARNTSPPAASASSTLSPAVGQLWNRFVNSDTPTLLVLSNPAVSGCTPEDLQAGAARPGTAGIQEACPDEYTGIGEAVALYLISNVFKSAKTKPIVKQSLMLSLEEARRSNLILLGGKLVNSWTKALGEDLSLTADDIQPALSGREAEQYNTAFDRRAGKLARDRALLALRRHPASGHWILFLYGAHSQGTHAVAEASIDERFLSQLKWPPAVAPFPDRFQVFVRVNVKDGAQHEAIPLAVRVP